MTSLLPIEQAPKDPVERVSWLNRTRLALTAELDAAYADAYFLARLEGHLDDALDLAPHSRSRVLAMTRAENERRGRSLRWRDGADATSSAYAG